MNIKAPNTPKPRGPRRPDKLTPTQLDGLIAEDKLRRLYNLGRTVDIGDGTTTYKDPMRSKLFMPPSLDG